VHARSRAEGPHGFGRRRRDADVQTREGDFLLGVIDRDLRGGAVAVLDPDTELGLATPPRCRTT